jgi:hypothetical protein
MSCHQLIGNQKQAKATAGEERVKPSGDNAHGIQEGQGASLEQESIDDWGTSKRGALIPSVQTNHENDRGVM